MSSDADLRRNILVPLDGSDVAESALPLACMLATEWEGVLSLVQVVPGDTVAARLGPNEQLASSALMQTLLLREARSYLAGVARSCAMTVNWAAVYGKPVETLSTLVREWWITDVVMGSHGRIGLDRITLGSVAEDLIKSLKVPVIVVPGTATGHRIQPRSHALGALTYVRT